FKIEAIRRQCRIQRIDVTHIGLDIKIDLEIYLSFVYNGRVITTTINKVQTINEWKQNGVLQGEMSQTIVNHLFATFAAQPLFVSTFQNPKISIYLFHASLIFREAL